MRISVVGCGYLGAVHAAAMASLGHDVVGIDVMQDKVDALNTGFASIYEPGLDELLQQGIKSGKLKFTTDFSEAQDAEAHFIGVGTPQKKDGAGADLSYLYSAVEALIPYLNEGDVVIGKSTVPVGTAQDLAEYDAFRQTGAILAWNPEFLREGHAIKDTVSPDRLVYGLPDGDEASARAKDVLDTVYASILEHDTPLIVTDFPTAELVKVSANAFLATKISFINAVAQIADKTGANITELADAIGLDDRIGRKFLNAGIGFGGGCLPKDIRAFKARADELGIDDINSLMTVVDNINMRQRRNIIERVQHLYPHSSETTVAVLGLAFKPESDDLRDSPALEIASKLAHAGYRVIATDPKSIEKAKNLESRIEYSDDVESMIEKADVMLLLTEWEEYSTLTPKKNATTQKTIIDGRNVLREQDWTEKGWIYIGIGRR